jgi:hypothetical protein
MASAPGKVKLNIDVDAELKQEFRVHCVMNKTNMTEIVEQLIRTYLSNFKEEKGAI